MRSYVVKAGLGKSSKSKRADEKNVAGLLYQAQQKGADVVAFLRDIDNHEERDEIILQGVSESLKNVSGKGALPLRVIAGFPRPNLEGWILALSQIRGTDEMSRARVKKEISELEISDRNVEEYVSIVEQAELEQLPQGCSSLSAWLDRAKAEMSQSV